MEKKRILHVINKKSGKNTDNNIDEVSQKLENLGNADNLIYSLSGEDDDAMIRKIIDEFKPDIVTAAGGDGTINFVASVIAGMPVKLGIIPLGSANGLAYDLDIPENFEEAARLITEETARPVDIVHINDKISIHLSDIGMNARIVKEFEEGGKRGFLSYAKHFMKEIMGKQKSFRCTISIDKMVYRHRSLMTLIANASKYRTGANMNPGGRIDDGKFEIIVMKAQPKWFWKSLAGAFTGTLHQKQNVEIYECSSAVIDVYPPEELQVDGEHLGKHTTIRASIHKHGLNVILPPEKL